MFLFLCQYCDVLVSGALYYISESVDVITSSFGIFVCFFILLRFGLVQVYCVYLEFSVLPKEFQDIFH